MSERLYSLIHGMLELAEAQRIAIHEGDYEEAWSLQSKRHDIAEKIQNIDGYVHISDERVGKKGLLGEDLSPSIRREIEKILSIDRELQTLIQRELTSIGSLLEAIQKAKSFCKKATYNKKASIFHTTA